MRDKKKVGKESEKIVCGKSYFPLGPILLQNTATDSQLVKR